MNVDLSSILQNFSSIGFWQYWKLKQCIASGLESEISSCLGLPRAPASRYALIGDFFHELMAINPVTVSACDVDELIEETIKRFQNKVDGDSSLSGQAPFGDWAEVNNSCDYFYNHYDSLKEISKNGIGAKVLPEKTLYNKTRELKGRPDLVFKSSAGITLVEYKSGVLNEECGAIKEEYMAQVHFYSYLIKENFGEWPSKVILKSLNGDEKDISISQTFAEKLVEDARGMFQLISNMTPDLKSFFKRANPEVANCRYCRLRPVCESFLLKQFEFGELNGRYAIEGKVLKLIDRGERASIEIQVTSTGEKIHVNNIYSDRIVRKNIDGNIIMLINLRIGTSNGILEGTKGTEVWIKA